MNALPQLKNASPQLRLCPCNSREQSRCNSTLLHPAESSAAARVDTPRLCFPYVGPGTLGQDDLSGLLEHSGDRKMAASIAREGTASSRVGTDSGDRLLRGATRGEQPNALP